jgi:hypothetical protein
VEVEDPVDGLFNWIGHSNSFLTEGTCRAKIPDRIIIMRR